jgi:hypothetical protein
MMAHSPWSLSSLAGGHKRKNSVDVREAELNARLASQLADAHLRLESIKRVIIERFQQYAPPHTEVLHQLSAEQLATAVVDAWIDAEQRLNAMEMLAAGLSPGSSHGPPHAAGEEEGGETEFEGAGSPGGGGPVDSAGGSSGSGADKQRDEHMPVTSGV